MGHFALRCSAAVAAVLLCACSGGAFAENGAGDPDASTDGGSNGSGGSTSGAGGAASGGSGNGGSGNGGATSTGGSTGAGGATGNGGASQADGGSSEGGVIGPGDGGVIGSDGSTGTGDGTVSPQCGEIGDCQPGEYCEESTLTCVPCSDLSRFRFATSQRVDAVSNTVAGNQRFPRVTHNGVEMFFVTGAWNAARQAWVTSDFTQTGNEVQFGINVNTNVDAVGGPLEAFTSVPGFSAANFYFDRTSAGPGTRRDLYAGSRSGTTVGASSTIPAPFNTPLSPSSNYSIAIATASQRVWWMTTRNNTTQAQLVTHPLSLASISTPAVVNFTLGNTNGCPRTGGDATPWVTPDGTLMLFRTIEVDSNCSAVVDANDLWYVRLDSTGQPSSEAIAISDVNTDKFDDTDPSLSRDLCWLYYSSIDESGQTPDYDVFRAPRK